MTEISHLYEKKNPGWSISLDLGKTVEALRKIETSAPIDVILTGDEKDFKELQEKNLIMKDTRLPLGSDEAILVTGANSSVAVKEIKDLNSMKSIAVAKDTTPMGKRVRKYLTKAGLLEALKSKFVEVKDGDACLEQVDKGSADVTFTYLSSINDFSKYRILLILPQTDFPSYTYSAGVASTTRNPAEAKEFLEILKSTSAQKIFENAGFHMPGRPRRPLQQQPVRPPQTQTQSQPQSQTQSQSQPQGQTQPQSQPQSQPQ